MNSSLNYYKKLWKLIDGGDPFFTPSSLLQPVKFNNIDCMLKIALADDEA